MQGQNQGIAQWFRADAALQLRGEATAIQTSVILPICPLAELAPLLHSRTKLEDGSYSQRFKDW
jgi:hypothetical protein